MDRTSAYCLCLLLSACCLAACAVITRPQAVPSYPPAQQHAAYTGTASCVPCHEAVFEHYRRTIHARIAPDPLIDRGSGCEACHGPGSEHVRTKGALGTIMDIEHLSPRQASSICLGCHTGAPVIDWQANAHLLHDVGCNECHRSHQVTGPKMVYQGDPAICFTCHQDKRTQHRLPSHHPVNERKMTCGSCHNSHGSENNNLREDTLNDLCFTCHTEYQGPFVYEHAPVVEDCSMCHDPHGTIADNLLLQNEPFICLRCHRGHRREDGQTTPHPDSFLTRCTQCHLSIHGSDLPSQVLGGGLTR